MSILLLGLGISSVQQIVILFFNWEMIIQSIVLFTLLQLLCMFFIKDVKVLRLISILTALDNFFALVYIWYDKLFFHVILSKIEHLFLWFNNNFTTDFWQYLLSLNNLIPYSVTIPFMDSIKIIYRLELDGLGIVLISLNYFLVLIAILATDTHIVYRIKEYHILIHLLGLICLHVFAFTDLLLFYIAFEVVLIPMVFIIGIWGSQDRKIHASYEFFLYTFIGSLFMLPAVLYIGFQVGSFQYADILVYDYTKVEQIILFLCFFIAFAIKMPLIPVHIWLTKAHVEAPTAGSMILAGILLKIGSYGLLKYCLPLFPFATILFQPLSYMFGSLGVIFGTIITIRQTDLKKIIAYSSITHMSYIFLGIMSGTLYGIEGAVFMMIAHGIVSSALFLIVGLIYERTHSRIILYYGGFAIGMPIFSLYFFLLTLANISLPGTISFIGEFDILIGLSLKSKFLILIALLGLILGVIYAFLIYNRVSFGYINIISLKNLIDFNLREFIILGFSINLIFFFGLYPNCLLEIIHDDVVDIIKELLKVK